jgi:catechol 2,3-dioxygenase-like lactoylglutathione lyase family enzyme
MSRPPSDDEEYTKWQADSGGCRKANQCVNEPTGLPCARRLCNESLVFREVKMLGDKDAIATVAVKDLKAAAEFYESTLGLKRLASEGEEAVSFRSGNSTVLVYRSQYAGSNKATAVTWAVGEELDAIVAALKAKGVSFEHYDLPGLRREGDIHIGGEMRVAWLKDPDGNILSLANH